jgi:hypothetical protein
VVSFLPRACRAHFVRLIGHVALRPKNLRLVSILLREGKSDHFFNGVDHESLGAAPFQLI